MQPPAREPNAGHEDTKPRRRINMSFLRVFVFSWPIFRARSSTCARSCGPHGSLFLLRHGAEPFVYEFLHAAALIGFGGVQVSLRIHRDAVHRIELARVVAAFAEVRELSQRLAIVDVELLI